MKTKFLLGLALIAASFPTMANAALSRASFAYSGGPSTSVVLVINNSLSITASNRGWLAQTGASNFGGNFGNHIVGLCGSDDACNADNLVRNNWFVFDLTGIDPVTSAELQLSQIDGAGGNDGYISTQASETYTVWDTDVSGGSLSSASGTALFDDLQSGISFGNVSVNASTIGTTVSVIFNGAGIAALNDNAGGLYGFGGSLGIAAVPEPAAWAMLIAGFGLTGAVMRRRRASVVA